MSLIVQFGTLSIGGHQVYRLGYGAMQPVGPGVFGPPKDRDVVLAVLREAASLGVNHIDMSDFYGLYITNQPIREVLHLYRDDLLIVTKIGARRGAESAWLLAFSAQVLTEAVHNNLRNPGLDVLDVVNLQITLDSHGPAEGSIEAPLTALAELQRQGLVRHIGLSNTTVNQITEGRYIYEIICVQNHHNPAHRNDDGLIDAFARDGIAYVPYFPLGGFSPLQSSVLNDVVAQFGATPMQTALVQSLQRLSSIPLIPGTSLVGHLRENLGTMVTVLPEDVMREFNTVTLSMGAAL